MLRVEKYVGVSEYVRSRGQKRFGLPDERAAVQYNGISKERFATVPVPHPGGAGTSPVAPVMILAVGSLIPEKGFDVLLHALAKTGEPSWHLRIAGEGPERGRLEELAARLAIAGRVDFLGLRDDVDSLAKQSDVFVHPAVWQEAFGYTVIEGMAARCCVLASRVGGIPELMVDGKEGFLLPPGDVDAWAQAIRRCLRDVELRESLASAARSRVLRDFTIERRISTELSLITGSAAGATRESP
jgi:glycosyltransferase involved in cell wall biosynthesis